MSTLKTYQRIVGSGTDTVVIDVYDVLEAFTVTNPATAHAIKKLLCPGSRGVKSVVQDLEEAKSSIERALQMEGKIEAQARRQHISDRGVLIYK